ncbi:MAG: CxxxxCH/CxxCH domain-containing protein, partial [Thermodesulfobacteriota bacterium]
MLATAGVALVTGAGGAGAATHYPTGSLCYDCHAVSKSKMVVGTHLIKKSDKTVALGVTGSSTPIPCLFCHEKNAVSVTGRTEMKGVWDHFDATSTSKHPAYVQSGFTPDGLRFDCLDCHTGITLGVVSDLAGNAGIHGIDAATQNLNLYGTLIGNPANAAAVSTATCRNAACHSATGSTTGGYTAPAAHGMNKTMPGATLPVVTINDAGGAPTSCTQCHGTHNSYQNTSLVTLRTDGTTSNNLGDPLTTRVTPDKCGECHSQDDAGVYTNKGHGQSTISGGTVGCTACHSGSVPHGFSRSAPGTNPLRFSFAENTSAQSSIRLQPPYNQALSICLTCHSQYTGKLHQGPTATAGCNDCHEPHGVGVGTNAVMIRQQIPKVNATGVPVYGFNSATGTWETNSYTVSGDFTYKTDNTALCDNAECHQGRTVNGDPIYPLSTLLTGGRHTGGDISTAADFDCSGCHTHTDGGGSWGAQDSCTTCHGQPPPPADTGYTNFAEANTPHQKHAGAVAAGGYGYRCQTCHFDYVNAATHNTPTKTYQSLNFDAARNPSPSRAYNAGTATCTNLYCHSDGQSTASVGSVQWMTGTNTPDWSTQDLACNACHGGIDAAGQIARGSHTVHLSRAGITCVSCHSGTLDTVGTNTTTSIPEAKRGAHANLTKDVVPGGTFNGAAVAFGFIQGTDTCSNISCHGGYADVAWGAAASCANCHGTFGLAAEGAAMPASVVAKHSGALANPDGNASTTLYNGHQGAAVLGASGEGRCDYCHANTQPDYTAGMHIDGVIQLNANMTYQGASGFTGAAAGCATACHSADSPYQMSDSGLALQHIAGQGFSCGACHTGGVTPASASAGHAAHGASSPALVDGGAACVACHGNNGGLNYQNALAGTHGSGTVTWATDLTYSTAVTRGDLTGTCTGAAGCHVAATNIAWNATPTNCTQCHVNTADRNDWSGNNNIASMIASGDWTATGHGAKADVGATGCLTCHDLAQPHDRTTTLSGANPYRLRDQDAGTAGVQFSCTYNAAACHDGNPTPSVATVKTHSNEEMANSGYTAKRTWPAWDPQCVNCHDPHGDGNLAMIRRDLYDKAAFNLPAGPPPAEPTEQTNLIFTNRTGVAANSYSWATEQTPNYSGVCQECHEAADHVAFKDNTSASVSPHPTAGGNPGQCSSCHPHSGAFKPSGCSGCHGDGANQYWPANAASNLRSAYPNRAGRHQKHMDVLAQRRYAKAASALSGVEQNAICEMCHNDASGVGGGTHYPSGYTWTAAPADVGAFNQMWGTYASDADGAYAAATYGGSVDTSPWTGGSSCSALDCHNSKTTGAGFEWYGATATACTMCHTRATTGSNPSSGLHYGNTAPTVSQAWHDDTLTTTNKCVVCHTTLTTQSTHINGAFTGNGTFAADRTAMGLFAAYTNGGTDGVGSCSGAAVGGAGCHEGGDAGTWARRWNSAIHYATDGTECAGCHGGMNETDWTFGSVANTTDNIVEHNRDWNGNATTGEVIGNHKDFVANTTKCNICHVYADSPYTTGAFTTYHRNGQITMNSTMGYSRTAGAGPAYGCSNTCHSAANSGMENSGWTLETIAGPALSCTSCHTGTGTGALAVGSASRHTSLTVGGAFAGCEACHPGGGKGSL